jgi:hypothetical protein
MKRAIPVLVCCLILAVLLVAAWFIGSAIVSALSAERIGHFIKEIKQAAQ